MQMLFVISITITSPKTASFGIMSLRFPVNNLPRQWIIRMGLFGIKSQDYIFYIYDHL